jgi:hypothetical protein
MTTDDTEDPYWTAEQRVSLMNKIIGVLPDGAPLEEVIGALASAICTVSERNGLDAERAIKAMTQGLAAYRKRNAS